MGKRSVSKRGAWSTIKRQMRLIVDLMRDRRVPIWMRAIPILGIVYLLSPIELLPDVALFPFGILDDLVVILICLTIFMTIVPRAIVDDH
ncbi:MAG: YkvA family protein, partial [Anaerolineae bacterium]